MDWRVWPYVGVEALRPEPSRFASLTGPGPLTVRKVQRHIVDRDSVLLQYFLGVTRSYVWAMTSRRAEVYALPGRAQVECRVQAWLDGMADGDAGGTRESGCRTAEDALAVSRMILGPVASSLDRSRILILADGILHLVPFAALPRPDATSGGLVPLVVDHEVVNLPSSSVLGLPRQLWRRADRWSRPVVVFADPVFEPDDPRLRARQGAAMPASGALVARPRELPGPFRTHIPRLAESQCEAAGVQTTVPGTVVHLGFDANRAAAEMPELSNRRIVHFATHAVVSDRYPQMSGIVLSMFGRDGRVEDGFIPLHDICRLPLPVDLVVLSACSRVPGPTRSGEGFLGLVRAFMHAGVRRMIASLWRVDGTARQALMVRFYQGLFERGLTPAAALRAAQVDLLASPRWGRSCDWAAFVLQGEWM